MSYVAKRVCRENLVFYIHKLNSDFNLDNKSLEIDLNNSLTDGITKRQYQPTNKEYTENGTESTSTRSETNRKGGGGNRLDSGKSAESTVPRGGGNERGKHSEQQSDGGNIRKNQDFSLAENSIIKRHKTRYMASRIKYLPTRVKSRNFLSNISYTGINKSDFYNENFILDVYILLVKNLNSFSLQRKTTDKLKHEMVYMLRRECIPSAFYRYIRQDTNFKYLNGRDVNQSAVLEIVGKFIDQNKENLRLLQINLANCKDI